MKIIFLILNWIFGGLLLFLGIISSFKDPIPGTFIVLASLFLIPSVREFVYSKTNKEISIGYRTLIVIVLLGIASATIPPTPPATEAQKKEWRLVEEKANAEKTKKIKDQNIKYFEENKVKILTEIELKIQNKNYKEAISAALKYLPSKNEELIRMDKEAKDFLDKKHKEQRAQAVAKAKKQKEERLAKAKLVKEVSIKNAKKQDISILKAAIGDLEDFRKFNTYNKLSLEELNTKLQAMRFMGKIIKLREKHAKNDKDILPIWQKAKKLQIQTQVVHYPKMRDALGPLMRKTMWEHNIHVKTVGKGYKRIIFSGGYFASNMNIKKTNEAIMTRLHDYRFKRVDYKWIKRASEWTYYDLDTKKDNEL